MANISARIGMCSEYIESAWPFPNLQAKIARIYWILIDLLPDMWLFIYLQTIWNPEPPVLNTCVYNKTARKQSFKKQSHVERFDVEL